MRRTGQASHHSCHREPMPAVYFLPSIPPGPAGLSSWISRIRTCNLSDRCSVGLQRPWPCPHKHPKTHGSVQSAPRPLQHQETRLSASGLDGKGSKFAAASSRSHRSSVEPPPNQFERTPRTRSRGELWTSVPSLTGSHSIVTA